MPFATPPLRDTTPVPPLRRVTLDAGPIDYWEAGSGPTVLFVHGFATSGYLWRKVAADLARDFRCVVPTWPMGSHAAAMSPDADLTPTGLAEIVRAFADRLGLRSFTLVGNDLGGAVSQIFATRYPERVDRLVLTPCDAFGNFPPPMFKYLVKLPRFAPVRFALSQLLRAVPLRRLPFTYGWLSRGALSHATIERFVRPMIEDPGVRRDAARVITGVAPRYTEDVVPALATFPKPVLLAWARQDRFFPFEHAVRLQALIPRATLRPIEDSYTLVAEDQPAQVAAAIRAFCTAN